ncbi:MAG: hypothetical protein MUE90_14175 [Thermoanaerobaculales bacterium]|nr:hypothetical protein [Thermoanaerobaculales bacterium]
MDRFEPRLPVLQAADEPESPPSCSPSTYISNEEAALLAAMRQLHERSTALRRELAAAEPGRARGLESELESLRGEWRELARRRERAFVRKMIMLGHLPPSADPGS